MKENCANWELSHVPTVVTKVGVKGNLVSIPSCPQQRLLRKNCKIKNYKKFSSSQEFLLFSSTVNIYPEDYIFIQNLTSSAEDLSTVIIKNDQSQNADLMLAIIKVYKTLEINEICLKYKWDRKFNEPKSRIVFIKLPINVVWDLFQ